MTTATALQTAQRTEFPPRPLISHLVAAELIFMESRTGKRIDPMSIAKIDTERSQQYVYIYSTKNECIACIDRIWWDNHYSHIEAQVMARETEFAIDEIVAGQTDKATALKEVDFHFRGLQQLSETGEIVGIFNAFALDEAASLVEGVRENLCDELDIPILAA